MICVDCFPRFEPVLNMLVEPCQGRKVTYVLINIPTAVSSAFLSLITALMNSEVPIHVSSLLLSSLFIRLEPSTALRTRGSEFIIKSGQQSRPESIQVSLRHHT